MERTIVYLHGIGGLDDIDEALSLINDHLGARGYPTIGSSQVIAVDYERILEGEATAEATVESTWSRPRDEVQAAERTAYVLRAMRLQARMERAGDGGESLWGVIPEGLADAATRTSLLRQVDRYAGDPAVRRTVWAAVLAALPTRGEIVMIGHSLGSVIAADLIAQLPKDLVVRSLITLGSPLGLVPRLRRHSELLREVEGFPFARVQAWVNLFDPGDVVTGGRGIAQRYPRALDVAVAAGNHSLNHHLNHPAVLEAIEEGLYATYELDRRDGLDPMRPLPVAWVPQILGFAWSQKLGDAYAVRDQRTRRRLRAARQEVARRSINDYRAQLVRLDQEALELPGDTAGGVRAAVSDLHLHPSESQLVDHPDDLLRGKLGDAELITLLIPAVRSWPAAPFEVAASPRSEVRQRALELLLARIRISGPGALPLGDCELATLILDQIHAAERDMGQEGNNAGGFWALAAVGVAALVAAPFTLGASVPAGLSGAAAITAGLAALGPGGMAGGIATIAALVGGAALAAGTGTAMALTEEQAYEQRTRARRDARRLAEFTRMSIDSSAPALRESLTTLLAVHRLSVELDIEAGRVPYAAVEKVLGILRAQHQIHRELAPDTSTTKDWEARIKIMTRLAEHLRPEILSQAEQDLKA